MIQVINNNKFNRMNLKNHLQKIIKRRKRKANKRINNKIKNKKLKNKIKTYKLNRTLKILQIKNNNNKNKNKKHHWSKNNNRNKQINKNLYN